MSIPSPMSLSRRVLTLVMVVAIFSGLCYAALSSSSEGLLGSRGVHTAAMIVFMGTVFLFIQYVAEASNELRRDMVRCAHGVMGGETMGRCRQCQLVLEERRHADTDTVAEYERRRKIKLAADQLRQTEMVRLAELLVPSLDQLRALDPQRFEDEVAAMFRRLGYEVEQTPYSGDFGRDAIMHKDGDTFLLECKRYKEGSSSGRPELQKFHSAMITDDAKSAFFVTTGGFARSALEFAKKASIEPVDGEALVEMMFRSKPATNRDDVYRSLCLECEAEVSHRARTPEAVLCTNGHEVAPTIIIDDVMGLSPGSAPRCPKCAIPMKLLKKNGKRFWGCSRYPECSAYRPYVSVARPKI